MAEIKKHFELTVNLKFDIDNTVVKDFNSLNVVLTVKNKPKKEFKQMKKLGKYDIFYCDKIPRWRL